MNNCLFFVQTYLEGIGFWICLCYVGYIRSVYIKIEGGRYSMGETLYTIGTDQQMDELLKALAEIVEQNG